MGLTLFELGWAFTRDFGGGGGGGSSPLALLASWAFILSIFVDHDAVEEATSRVNVIIRGFMAVSSHLHSGLPRI